MRSPTLAVIVAVMLAFLSVPWSAPAVAQGTMGQFPDPISTPELAKLLERYVSLRLEQWPAVESAHDDYRREYQTLRDGDIQRLLDETRKLQMTIPSVAVVQDLLRRTDRVTARIRALDERLLDQVALALDDAQVASLPRVRQARERARNLSSQATMWVGGMRPTDLSALVLEIDLPADRRRAVDAILLSYEPTLTRHTAALREAGDRMMLGMVETMEEAGMADMSQEDLLADPARMQELMEAMQQAWIAIMDEARKPALAIRELNHRTRRSIVEALDEETGRDFKRRFLVAAYPSTASMPAAGETTARQVLRSDSLDTAQREAIESLLRNYLAADDRVVEDLVALADEQTDATNPMDFDSERMMDFQRRQLELGNRRQTLANELHTNLEAILGVEGLARAARTGDRELDGGSPIGTAELMAARETGAAVADGDASIPPPPPPGGGLVRGPIDARRLGAWVGLLGLEAERRTVLEALHRDYLDRWRETIDPMSGAVARIWGETATQDPANGQVDYAAISERVRAHRSAAREAADTLDREFIEGAAAAVARDHESGLFRLFLLERELIEPDDGTGMAFSFGMDANREQSVNIVRILLETPDARDLLPIVEVAVLEHADALRQSTREVRRAQAEQESLMLRMGSEYSAAGGDAARMAEIARSMQERMAAAARRVSDANERRRGLNRAILADLETMLPSEHYAKIRRAYRTAAWPTIYGGAGSPMPLIERALSLSDLDDDQRASIERIRDEAESAFEEASERMVAVSDQPMTTDFSSSEAMQRWTERQQAIQRVRFERNEVASRAIRRLRAVLTEEQAERMPGLATFDETLQQGGQWWE